MLHRCLLVVVVTAAVAAPASAESPAPAEDRSPGVCAVDWMIEAARAGLRSGSPAYRKYMRALLAEAAPTVPLDALLDAVSSEQDPDVLEAVGAPHALRASSEEDPLLLQRLLDRAAGDGDPAIRAAAVRALRSTASVATMAALGDAVSYVDLIRDPSPEVRAAIADNLVAESRDVYAGRDAQVADTAARVAMASPDPAIASRVLAEISMARASPASVAALTKALAADAPAMREGAALALGSAPPSEQTRDALVKRYRREPDVRVRAGLLQAIARTGQASAAPTLRSLRGIDARLDAEIDTWLDVLGLGLQEWHLILREKLKRTGGQP